MLQLYIYGGPGELRTMKTLIENGRKVEAAQHLRKAPLGKLKTKMGSSNGVPFLTAIPMENYCPPPLHLNMAAFNLLWTESLKKK